MLCLYVFTKIQISIMHLRHTVLYLTYFPISKKRKLPLRNLTPLPDALQYVPIQFDIEYPYTIYETDCKGLYFSNKKPE